MIRKFVPLIFLALFTSIIFANGKGDSQASEGIVEIEWLAYNTYGQPDSNSPIITAMEEKYNCEFNFWYIDDSPNQNHSSYMFW